MTHIETIYGNGILNKELDKINQFVVVTDEVPWKLHHEDFAADPLQVIMPDTLDKAKLDEIILSIPEKVEFVGLGGGTVLDATKYFAFLREKKPVLVPTITSTNAPFSDFMSVTNEKGFRTGFKKLGWPKRVVIDYNLISKANPRFNRAGYGDLLFMLPTLNDWRMASKAGKGVPVDLVLEERMVNMMENAIEYAPVIGTMGAKGIEILMKLIEDSTKLIMANMDKPISAGSEHLFAWNLEITTGRHFIHGEIVSLGILISSYLQGTYYNDLKKALDEAQVVYHPDDLELEWGEIKETLLTIEEYNEEVRQFNSVFENIDWTTDQLEEIRSVIYS